MLLIVVVVVMMMLLLLLVRYFAHLAQKYNQTVKMTLPKECDTFHATYVKIVSNACGW